MNTQSYCVGHLVSIIVTIVTFYFIQGEFVDGGAENHFCIGSTPVHIKTFSSGHTRKGLLYKLVVGDEEFEPVIEATAD